MIFKAGAAGEAVKMDSYVGSTRIMAHTSQVHCNSKQGHTVALLGMGYRLRVTRTETLYYTAALAIRGSQASLKFGNAQFCSYEISQTKVLCFLFLEATAGSTTRTGVLQLWVLLAPPSWKNSSSPTYELQAPAFHRARSAPGLHLAPGALTP